jgi:hypothetical protein
LTPGGRVISVDDAFPRLRPADIVVLKELAESGDLKPVIDRIYPLESRATRRQWRQGLMRATSWS